MATIYEAVTSENIKAYWDTKKQEIKPFLLEAFFPSQKKIGIDLSWIKGANNNIVRLSPSTFDAKVIPLSRKGFTKLSTDMPFFKNSLRVDESQRQELNKITGGGNQSFVDILLENIYNDKVSLLRNADITREIMRAQLITSGVVSVNGNGVSESYDYGVTNSQKKTVDWTASNANPISDIASWQDQIESSTGERPTNLIINTVTLNTIANTSAVKNAIYVFANGTVTPTREQVKKFIQDQTGCNVFVYDKGYTNDNGVFTKFISDYVVSLIPNKVGNTWFGTTPEESDLLASNVANVSIVDTGVAITTSKIIDPVTVETKVSQIVLPSGEFVNQMIIADVNGNS